jgi:hypothetical protein
MANTEFVPGRGMPCPASPAFTDNSIFAQRVTNALIGNLLNIASPRQEDAAWASELENSLPASYPQATIEPVLEHPLVATSSNPLAQVSSRARSKPPSDIAENPVEGGEADDEEERHTLRRSRSSQQLPRRNSSFHSASRLNADPPHNRRNSLNDNPSSSPSSSSGSSSRSRGSSIPFARGP